MDREVWPVSSLCLDVLEDGQGSVTSIQSVFRCFRRWI